MPPEDDQRSAVPRDASTWNAWRAENPGQRPDLRDAVFAYVTLKDINLAHSNLAGVSFLDATFTGANLDGARLLRANVDCVDFRRSNFKGADLTSVDVDGCSFDGASFVGADLSKATFTLTDFSGTDFTGARLGGPYHRKKSAGRPFNPGATFRRVKLGDISYSGRDEPLARLIYAFLQDHGVRCWCATEDMRAGARIRDAIHEAIGNHEKLLLILSKTRSRAGGLKAK